MCVQKCNLLVGYCGLRKIMKIHQFLLCLSFGFCSTVNAQDMSSENLAGSTLVGNRPVESNQEYGLEVHAGNSVGVMYNFHSGNWADFDFGYDHRLVRYQDWQVQNPGQIDGYSRLIVSLRKPLFHNRIQAGVEYVIPCGGEKYERLSSEYKSQIRALGYILKINLLQFSTRGTLGNKLYFTMVGMKKNTIAPNEYRFSYVFYFRNQERPRSGVNP